MHLNECLDVAFTDDFTYVKAIMAVDTVQADSIYKYGCASKWKEEFHLVQVKHTGVKTTLGTSKCQNKSW